MLKLVCGTPVAAKRCLKEFYSPAPPKTLLEQALQGLAGLFRTRQRQESHSAVRCGFGHFENCSVRCVSFFQFGLMLLLLTSPGSMRSFDDFGGLLHTFLLGYVLTTAQGSRLMHATLRQYSPCYYNCIEGFQQDMPTAFCNPATIIQPWFLGKVRDDSCSRKKIICHICKVVHTIPKMGFK